ncbi:SDR family NAD(P)-dependent oxidoreductase [Flavobacterium psychrotrophum]|uniref:SDR family NAD(P)-dependent oxidoreductase n=1 Tax=Flavobacterium psychrotrophum TaxID=2294119 RepID=UPI000E31E7C8|nr:SDR family oxidoreductase [Flavobacterium psychrotrophum]
MNRLKDKVAVITGGAGSIGKATAKLFLAHGAKVMLVDLGEDALKEAIAELGSENVAYTVADVTKFADAENYAQKTVERFGAIDVFFNNAGIEGVVKPLTEYPEDVFDKVLAVNVKGVWFGNKAVYPKMNDGGSIIISSSVAGLSGTAGTLAYTTSKHAVIGLMKVSALEFAERKIRVNTVNPSPVDNRMMRSLEEGFAPGHAAAVKADLEKTIPLARYAQPEEISAMVLFLASDDSKFITGTYNRVDGGMGAK